MEDSHSLTNSEIVHDETDLAEKRLNEAMAQRKKELQQEKALQQLNRRTKKIESELLSSK